MPCALPYACTYDPSVCHETFLSYLHWMRHEVSHGEHPKMWHCGEISDRGDICHVVCNRAKAIRGHLIFEHGIEIFLDIGVQSFVTGPSNYNYWCGFCSEIIKVERPVMDIEWAANVTWTYHRIDHMAVHFGGSKDILDWIKLDNISS
jgi:hypothetical protein